MDLDFEKAWLVVNRSRSDGAFSSFQWVSPDRMTHEELIAKIAELNGGDGRATHEIVTDSLAREICSYLERSRTIESMTNDIESFKNAIKDIEKKMESIESDFRDAKRELRDLLEVLP